MIHHPSSRVNKSKTTPSPVDQPSQMEPIPVKRRFNIVLFLSMASMLLRLSKGFTPRHFVVSQHNNLATTTTTRLYRVSSSLTSEEKTDLEMKIKVQGDKIRALKESGADKTTVGPLVQELLALKEQLDPESVQKKKNVPKQKQQQQNTPQKKATVTTEEESDFITPRSVDYSKWYNDLIRCSGMAENSPVRGCMVIKPWGMALWDRVRTALDTKIQQHGAENAYFPLLIPQSFLSKEAEHVDGFAKECAVVTHHRLTTDTENGGGLIADPTAALEDPLIIRPTSETMIWYMFRKWIGSHRDLPLKINQWANVMRWELRTRPFLRTSEFLWQEGHTAHATRASAQDDATRMMDNYAALCTELLAMPVVRGVKSPSERFAGAEETYTIEALMQNGWALQSGTAHFLGQSFGKAFNVTFQDEQGQQQDVWGTSWGVSTRLLGALVMTHADDAGLVLPPLVAPVQVVIVPIAAKKSDAEGIDLVKSAVDNLQSELQKAGVRVKVDDREYVRFGAKMYEWERKGVPLRIELGPRDAREDSCIFKYRSGKSALEKQKVALTEAASVVQVGLDSLQKELFSSAKERLDNGITQGVSYEDMKEALDSDEATNFPGKGLFLVPWKCDAANEAKIKEECKATIRCYPLEANAEGLHVGQNCFYSGDPATHMALFGRAF